jgi:hypothetical protein
MVLKIFRDIIPSFLCNLHQVVLLIFFPPICFCVLCCFVIIAFLKCSFLFCQHLSAKSIFVQKKFLLFVPMSFFDPSSLCFLHVHFYHTLDYWPIGSPFHSSFTLTLQHVFHNMSRVILGKTMASSQGSGLTSVQLLHTFLFPL